jgi:hypothetical protein
VLFSVLDFRLFLLQEVPTSTYKRRQLNLFGIVLYGTGIAIRRDYRLQASRSGFDFRQRDGFFTSVTTYSPPAACPTGTEGSFPRVKRPKCVAHHSTSTSAEVLNACRALPPKFYVRFHRMVLTYGDTFTFTCRSYYVYGTNLKI